MATGKPFQSKKVDRTLRELEVALADWQTLADRPEVASETEKDIDLRKKTQALLEQLREQLAELGE